MDRLEAMTVFLETVEAGSLSAAGRRLGMPLASVSRKIGDLEAHLKIRLLNRSTRRLTLTDAGRSYVVACKRILEDVGQAERAATGEYMAPRGDLSLTAPVVFGRLHIVPVVAEFLRVYPDINVRLVLADRVVHLLEEHLDLAIRIGDLPDSSMIAVRLGTIRRVVCASPEYLSKHGTPRAPEDLESHQCIAFEALQPMAWNFLKEQAEISIPIRPRLSVTTAEASIDAAIAGVGVTRVLCYQIAAARQAGTLFTVLEPFEPAPWPVSLVYASQGLLPLKLRAFLDFAAPRLKARLADSAAASAA